jgi:hypothetical protein
MSSGDREDIRPGEDLYDQIDRLVDEDPIALRNLAWQLLAERDTARADLDAAEARGYHKAIDALDFGAYSRWGMAEESDGVQCMPREMDSIRRFLGHLDVTR